MRRIAFLLILFFLLLPGYKVQAQADISASTTEGCTSLAVKFSLDESTVNPDTITSIAWDFGNGETSDQVDPDSVTYNEAGVFSIEVVINGNAANPVEKVDYITTHRTVSAAFNYEEFASGYNYRFIPLDQLTDQDEVYTYTWEYFDINGTDDRVNIEPDINYLNQARAIDSITLDTGIYLVNLTIVDQVNGCNAVSSERVIISDEVAIPNYFLYGDGRYYVIDPQDFTIVLNFQVFNRYGSKVFEQTSPVINWNGETSWGRQLTTGVYFYILEAVEGDPLERYSKQGFIHLYPSN